MTSIETKAAWRGGIASLVLAALAGCAVIAEPGGYPAHQIGIPPGHMPPPGSCRIWYPDRPPGQQPPPGSCGVLRYQVPAGAYLVYG